MALSTLQINTILNNALSLLSREKNVINNLNVFPVPDGDTGLNMTLTLQGALNSLKNYNLNTLNIQEYLKYFAHGMILNSRGCSGVILALFCKGVSDSLQLPENLDNISNNELANAFWNGYESAFQETANPAEGTILTMMKVLSKYYAKYATNNSEAISIIKKTIPALEETLEKTPEMLPVLKKAGVVDSGALGFLVLIKGLATELEYNGSLLKHLMTTAHTLAISKYVHSFVTKKKYGKQNRLIKTIIANFPPKNINNLSLANIIRLFNNFMQKKGSHSLANMIIQESEDLYNSWNPDIRYKYCTEFILEGNKITSEELHLQLEPWGDNLLIIRSNNSFKIHIHTNKPKPLIKLCAEFGEISSTKVDDMKKQHRNLISEDKAYYNKDNAVLLIVNGEGFAKILKGLGATDILVYKRIKPSVTHIKNALIKTRAKNIITAADDSDILTSLKSAIAFCKSNIELIETQDIMSIINMMYNYSNNADIIQNSMKIRENLESIKFCKIAQAKREYYGDSLIVKRGDFFTIYKNKILLCATQIDKVIIESISKILGSESLITLYSGRMEIRGEKILSQLQSEFKGIDFETYYGGQNKFNFYITFE